MSAADVKFLDGTGIHDAMPESKVFEGGSMYDLQQIWIRQEKIITPQPPAGSEEYEWVLVKSLVPPPNPVPNVQITGPTAINIGPTQTGNVTVSWSSTSELWTSTFSVRVKWYVNGAYYDAQVVSQGDGSVTYPFYGGSNVYAVVSYVNQQGDGPTTTTETVHIGF